MANPIIKIKRGSTAPATGALAQGEFAVDQVSKNLYLGISDGVGGTINEIVGGSGTFATKQFVTDAVSAGTGSLGTMSTQNADSVAITGGAIDGTAIGATTASSGAFTSLTASSAPSASTDVVRKTDLDSAISALGSVIRYIGVVPGTDLDSFPDTTTGAYYTVDVDDTYTASGGYSVAAKEGDAFVKTTTGWQKLDNVDAVVSGTANEISVSGDENAGYTVSIDPIFSGRVSTAETEIDDLQTKTQNIDLAGTTAGTTQINDKLVVALGTNAPELVVQGVMEPEVLKVSGDSVTIAGSSTPAGALVVNGATALNGSLTVGISGNLLFVDGATNNLDLGNYWAGDVRVLSPKLVGVDDTSGVMPAIENFLIDGGSF